MGNGFPVGGILIKDHIKSKYGMLGTTFGGNHLACSAVLAVLSTIKNEKLLKNSKSLENYFREKISLIKAVKKIKGRGLMLGLEFDFETSELRKNLKYRDAIESSDDENINKQFDEIAGKYKESLVGVKRKVSPIPNAPL